MDIDLIIGQHQFSPRPFLPEQAARVLSALTAELGIPAQVRLHTDAREEFLTLHNKALHFPEDILTRMESYTLIWEKQTGKEGHELFWKGVLEEIFRLHAAELMHPAMLPELVPECSEHWQGPTTNKVSEVLATLLSMHLPLTDRDSLTRCLLKYLLSDKPDKNVLREDLVESLAVRELVVQVNRDYFMGLRANHPDGNIFQLLREGLFYETGLVYPDIRIEFDEQMVAGTFRFGLYQYRSLPYIGLSDRYLANALPEELDKLKVPAEAAVNPANGYTCSLVDPAHLSVLREAGMIVWDKLGYFILCFSDFLRRYGYLSVDRISVTQMIEKVKLIYPAIVAQIQNLDRVDLVTGVIRQLAQGGLSVRNQRQILMSVLESDYVLADGINAIVVDERIPLPNAPADGWHQDHLFVTEFVRSRMKYYISQKYHRGQSALPVLLLGKELELQIEKSRYLEPGPRLELEERIKKSLKEGILGNYSNLRKPVMLANISVRPQVRTWVESIMPAMPVLSYQELSAEIRIEQEGRIPWLAD